MTELSDQFDPAEIHWRVGSTTKDKTKGMALAFIDARNVMDRLDESVGSMNWRDSYCFEGKRTLCTIEIRDDSTNEWVGKTDGAGDTDVESEKGALSDAFKRAAVKWGIGRYLYALDSPWVAIEPAGRSFRIAKSEIARLAKACGAPTPTQPAHGKSEANGSPKPDGPNASSLPEKNQSPGLLLLNDMAARFHDLGLDNDRAAYGRALNEIILVELALEKSLPVLRENMDSIRKHINKWTPKKEAA